MAEVNSLRASGSSQENPLRPSGSSEENPLRPSGSTQRRRLSPDDRRNELLALGAEVFGQRPYDEVRIDEIAERAGVSRALMYHYFPDKRAFFAEVVRAEGERLFEATNTPPQPDLTLFEQLRAGVLAYVHYDEEHPHGAWTAYIGMVRSDPVLRGIEDVDNDRQANRILAKITEAAGGPLDSTLERDVRVIIYAWLAFTFEMCRQRIVDPSVDAGYVADSCAHSLLDGLARIPGIPTLE
jgi:AcrR family transcriptional regulator